MKYLKLFILILIPLMLTGCYDKKELDDLAYVIAIGIDKDDEDDKKLKLTYQIAIPLKISGTDSKSEGKDNYTTYTVSAPSLYLGNSIVNTMTSKEVNLSNVKLILYSEELARDDLSGHISELVSNVDIRPKTTIAICRGKPEKFLSKVSPILESSPARYYELFFNSNKYTNMALSSELIDFYTSAQSIDRDSHAIILEIKESDKEVETTFEGIAVFDGGKMIGEIPIKNALAHLIATNSLNQGSIGIKDIQNKEDVVTFSISLSRNCKYEIEIKDSIPKIKITSYINAHLVSSESTTDYVNTENRNKLKQSLENKLTTQLLDYLNLLKEFNSDIVAIGKHLKANYLTWDEFEKVQWKEIFKNAEFEVVTKVDLNVSETAFHRLPNK